MQDDEPARGDGDVLGPSGRPREPRRWRGSTGVLAAVLTLVAVATVAVATSPGEGDPGSDRASLGSREAAAAQAPVEIWAIGDGADGGESGRRIGAMIAAARPARMLYLGDVYEQGTRSEFADNYAPAYGALARRTLPTPGNHDWPRHAEGYNPYWKRVTGRPMPSVHANRIGGWDILSLNSEAFDAYPEQVRWLERQVSPGGTCRLAFWHRPRFSAGSHGDEPAVAPFWRTLRGRAALVLNGHEHNMQEMKVRDGIRELISGAGGHSHYKAAKDPRLAWSNTIDNGALRLRLRPGRADYAFVTLGGRVLRSGTATCRPA